MNFDFIFIGLKVQSKYTHFLSTHTFQIASTTSINISGFLAFYSCHVNSLTPGNAIVFFNVICEHMLQIKLLNACCEIAVR